MEIFGNVVIDDLDGLVKIYDSAALRDELITCFSISALNDAKKFNYELNKLINIHPFPVFTGKVETMKNLFAAVEYFNAGQKEDSKEFQLDFLLN